MTSFHVKKGTLAGSLAVPASKSHTLRAILFASLAKGKSVISHFLPSPDAWAMVEACRLLGTKIDCCGSSLEIQGLDGTIAFAEDVIDAGNSGIVLRFSAAVGALATRPIVITGDHSIRHQRPMKPLLAALSELGVSASSMRGDGYAPVIIQGPLKPGKTTVLGQDSQPVSALLIASAFASGPSEICVEQPGELPWIDLTLDWFKRLGIVCDNQGYRRYLMPGKSSYLGFEYSVAGDLSSAAFPIVAALISRSKIELHNIDMQDVQGDKAVIYQLQKMGGEITIDQQRKTVQVDGTKPLCGMEIDINAFIDAITILAVVGCYAEGETLLYNGAVARQKECNRIACIARELQKMGADIHETVDGLHIRKARLQGAQVDSHHDHRMAMSLAVAALGAEGSTLISNVECIAKTFPTFLRDFNALGAAIEVVP